jgi:hypothetical protein
VQREWTLRRSIKLNALECHGGEVVRDEVVVAASGCTEGGNVRLGSAKDMAFQITLHIAAVFQEFTLVFLFFTSLLLHHSIDLNSLMLDISDMSASTW